MNIAARRSSDPDRVRSHAYRAMVNHRIQEGRGASPLRPGSLRTHSVLIAIRPRG
jgi:hypothetical protein